MRWLVLVAFFLLIPGVSAMTVTENTETTCLGDGLYTPLYRECTTVVYSYQKYFANETGEMEPINESITTEGCDINYDFCVVKNRFNYKINYKKEINESQSIKYERNGSVFTFYPLTLNYRNDLDQIQQIGISNASGYTLNKNNIKYRDIFTEGIDITFDYLPNTLREKFILANNTLLPEPEQYIIDGGNVTVDIDYQVIFDPDVDIYVDNVAWNKKGTTETQGKVEFFKDGVLLYYMDIPIAYDDIDTVLGQYTLKKQGNSFYVTISIPYSWINDSTRVYPLIIDPDVVADYNNIVTDVEVRYNYESSAYGYRDRTDYFEIGRKTRKAGLSIIDIVHHDNLEFNLSGVLPHDAYISNATLHLTVSRLPYSNYENPEAGQQQIIGKLIAGANFTYQNGDEEQEEDHFKDLCDDTDTERINYTEQNLFFTYNITDNTSGTIQNLSFQYNLDNIINKMNNGTVFKQQSYHHIITISLCARNESYNTAGTSGDYAFPIRALAAEVGNEEYRPVLFLTWSYCHPVKTDKVAFDWTVNETCILEDEHFNFNQSVEIKAGGFVHFDNATINFTNQNSRVKFNLSNTWGPAFRANNTINSSGFRWG